MKITLKTVILVALFIFYLVIILSNFTTYEGMETKDDDSTKVDDSTKDSSINDVMKKMKNESAKITDEITKKTDDFAKKNDKITNSETKKTKATTEPNSKDDTSPTKNLVKTVLQKADTTNNA